MNRTEATVAVPGDLVVVRHSGSCEFVRVSPRYAERLGFTGEESFDIDWGVDFTARQTVAVKATSTDGTVTELMTRLRVDTPVEVDYIRNGGILHTVLRRMAAS